MLQRGLIEAAGNPPAQTGNDQAGRFEEIGITSALGLGRVFLPQFCFPRQETRGPLAKTTPVCDWRSALMRCDRTARKDTARRLECPRKCF